MNYSVVNSFLLNQAIPDLLQSINRIFLPVFCEFFPFFFFLFLLKRSFAKCYLTEPSLFLLSHTYHSAQYFFSIFKCFAAQNIRGVFTLLLTNICEGSSNFFKGTISSRPIISLLPQNYISKNLISETKAFMEVQQRVAKYLTVI